MLLLKTKQNKTKTNKQTNPKTKTNKDKKQKQNEAKQNKTKTKTKQNTDIMKKHCQNQLKSLVLVHFIVVYRIEHNNIDAILVQCPFKTK